MTKKERFEKIFDWFQKEMPVVETELVYHSSFELIVAVILSAQCTDKRVNKITPALLKAYPDAHHMAAAEESEILEFIKSCSYPNSKARYLKGMSEKLVSEFEGKVPADMKSLQTLPGVGRKTASVIISVAFKQPAMAVDTHVFRVSERLGLSANAKTPLQTEKQLVKYIPEELLQDAHHWLILHGRYVCTARNPKCHKCGLKDLCKFYAKQNVSN
ncbi:MAG: endonuclease III [Bacteroidales bacterium]